MWDIARAAVLGNPKTKDAESQGGSESAPNCGFFFLARIWGSVSAVLVMVFGFFNLISCLQWAIYMMIFGFVLLILEASFVAGMFDCSEGFSRLLGKVKPWQKFVLYCMTSVPPLIGCFGITTLIVCMAWFSTGVIYMMLFLASKTTSPHSVSYSSAGDEAKLNLISNQAEEGDEKEEEEDGASTRSAWWPLSTQQSSTAATTKPSGPAAAKGGAAVESRAPAAAQPSKPAMTGTLPDSVPPAFPEPVLPGGSTAPRTQAYTGPIKPVTAALLPTPRLPAPSNEAGRTVAYGGPLLKPVGSVTY